jgi:hypothetical protein
MFAFHKGGRRSDCQTPFVITIGKQSTLDCLTFCQDIENILIIGNVLLNDSARLLASARASCVIFERR